MERESQQLKGLCLIQAFMCENQSAFRDVHTVRGTDRQLGEQYSMEHLEYQLPDQQIKQRPVIQKAFCCSC